MSLVALLSAIFVVVACLAVFERGQAGWAWPASSTADNVDDMRRPRVARSISLLPRPLERFLRRNAMLCTFALAIMTPTGTQALDPSDGHDKPATSSFWTSPWDVAASFLSPWTSTDASQDVDASEVMSASQDEDAFLRGAYELDASACNPDQFYDDVALKCVNMKEFGSNCAANETCFSGSCIDSRCDCPDPSNCWGCSSEENPCFRIEQSHPFQLLQVCRLAATVRGKENQKFKLFSAGGKEISGANGHDSLGKMVIAESQTSEIECTEFLPFVEDSSSGDSSLPPAFAQANILTDDGDDVYELVVAGPFDGLLDGIVFLDGNWISTINEDYRHLDDHKAIIPVWPRQNDGGLNASKTLVIEVDDEFVFDFDVGHDFGVELLGITDNATVYVKGSNQMDGRLSFKNVRVSFEGGSINATGEMIFQHSEVVDLFRCPPFFRVLQDLCFFATEMIDQADDAVETCASYDRGFLAKYDDVPNMTAVANKLLRKDESMWIYPAEGAVCSSLNQKGAVVSYPNLFEDNSTCEEYTRVLCAASVKKAITGRQYTSYFSNQYILNHRDLFERIVDPERLPVQLGANLTVYLEDGYEEDADGELVATTFTVTDEVPIGLSVVANLASGDDGDIQVALDSFDQPSVAQPHEWPFLANSSLPTKIQVHATGPVCVSSVDLFFRNETGTDHLAIRIPATLFETCLDLNVCDENDTRLCGRSLMFLNKTQGCAVLATDDPIYPRDLSLNLFKGFCSRLSTWNHPSLGEPFLIELDHDFNGSTDIKLSDLASNKHRYVFEAGSTNVSQELDESHVLPTLFRLEGGDGGLVKSVSITRYSNVTGVSQIISGVNFSLLWNCINVCEAVATSSGLLLGENLTELAMLDLLNEIECRKLISISTEGGENDGRGACTTPTINVTSLVELNQELLSLDSPDQPYRTLAAAVVNASIDENGTVVVPTDRGLRLSVEDDDTSLTSALFVVQGLGELYLEDITLDECIVSVAELGLADISGCAVSRESASLPFLVNAGDVIITSAKILGFTRLQNVEGGHLDLTYVEFLDDSSLENADEGVVELSRLSLYEEFIEPSQKMLGGGKVILEEANRLFDILDDEEDPLCFGNDSPDLTLELNSLECMEHCNKNFFACSGVLAYFDDENKAQCDFCLNNTDCAFNCSSVNSVYYKPKSSFSYTSVMACPVKSRPFEPLEGASLEECKLYCNWYKTCEGFRLDRDADNNSTTCNLFADLDLNDTCAMPTDSVYIPYLPVDPEKYLAIKGVLLDPTNPLAVYFDKNVSECSELCAKTLYCSSFYAMESGGDCTLHRSNDFHRTLTDTGLHISVDDIFPKKRYMEQNACRLDSSFAEFNTKTLLRCQTHCDDDLDCAGFSFEEFTFHNVSNCKLHNRTAVIDESSQDNCQTTVHIAYATESFVPNVLEEFKFVEVASVENLLEYECKALCLYDAGCMALQYSAFVNTTNSSHCAIGVSISSEMLRDFGREDFLVLDATEESFVPNVLEEFRFVEVASVINLLEYECKALCLSKAGCMALQYSAFVNTTNSSHCALGVSISSEILGDFVREEFLVLEARSSDLGSAYFSTPACYEGENITVDAPIEVQRAYGYTRWPMTCTSASPIKLVTIPGFIPDVRINVTINRPPQLIPAYCGLLCDQVPTCGGFIYYVNYTGPNNLDKIGTCELIGGQIDVGVCDAVEENTDVYLRSDVGSVCEAACNVHQLCTSFVPRILNTVTGNIQCELYSDIALFGECGPGENKTSVHVGLSYRERDALVALGSGQCFIEFEDIAEIGCYGSSFPTDLFSNQSVASVTPHHCQQHCKMLGEPIYAVSKGNECYCSNSTAYYSDLELFPENCTTPCEFDPHQSCGGSAGYALIGSTDLPRTNVTLGQCKRECFEDEKCEAILFDSTSNECELRATALFKTCDSQTPSTLLAFIVSLEHYYESPKNSYIGSEVIHTTSTGIKPDCHKLCDAFLNCEAVEYDELSSVNNCMLLGGDVVRLEANQTAEGVDVARDVTSFTKGFMPDSTSLTSFFPVFDLDECKALCEEHAECGAMVFGNRTCTLYPRSGFADVDSAASNSTPHYVDFRAFVDVDEEFVEATGFCIDDSVDEPPVPLSVRATTQSAHDCAARCNEVLDCRLFTYNEQTSSDCVLYGEDAGIKDACSGVMESTFLMYTRGLFTQRGSANDTPVCLKDEANASRILLSHKSIVECAALCDAWFNCRSFRSDEYTGECRLYKQEQFSKDFCSDSVPAGELYVYFSELFFARLTTSYCVASNSIIGDMLLGVPLEACKTVCDKHELCVALEHNQNGDCALYSSSDFSVPCTETTDRTLYIGYKEVVELGKNKYEYKPMEGCFNLSASSDWESVDSEEECQDSCQDGCLGYQFFHQTKNPTESPTKNPTQSPTASPTKNPTESPTKNPTQSPTKNPTQSPTASPTKNPTESPTQNPTEGDCHLVTESLPSDAPCRTNETFEERFSFRIERYPYQKMDNTCLLNEIYNITDENYRMYDTDEYECLALCDAHPSCRYYLWGDDLNDQILEVRECRLFKAQAQELDKCNCTNNANEEYGRHCGRSAYVNGRTFIDQVTHFGEPESTYAVLSGLSYQECAALCDGLDNQYCSAFLHTWNYRKESSAVEPQIFTKTRITRGSFGPNDDYALFLQFNGNGSGTDPLIMSAAQADNDDALKVQQLVNEFTGADSEAFRLRFWSRSGKCVAASSFSELPSPGGFTREVLYKNFSHVATCQSLVIDSCDNNDTIVFKEVEYLTAANPGRFALTYNLSNPTANASSVGCLGVEPLAGTGYYELTQPENSVGSMIIPPEVNCSDTLFYNTACQRTIEVLEDENGAVVENTTSWHEEGCNFEFVDEDVCSTESEPVPNYFNTTEHVTMCRSPPTQTNCSSESVNANTTITRCYFVTDVNETTCWHTQRNALDLLLETDEHFGSAPQCLPSTPSTTTTRSVFSRTYGRDCGYDDEVATMPIQLFAYASDPVLLSNDATGRAEGTSRCLSSGPNGLSLVECTDSAADEWVHIFGEGDSGGELFYADGDHRMKCLTRTSDPNSATVFAKNCSSSEGSIQRWEYDGNNGLLKVPQTETCLIANSTHVQLGNCADGNAKWSQYSECRLNTRVSTEPMKVESLQNEGKCIGGDVQALVNCSSAPEFTYYYDPNSARLELEGSSPPQCLARYTDDPASLPEPEGLNNGLMNCGNNDTGNVQYYLTILGGEEADIFQWSRYTLDGEDYVPSGPRYCIDVPSPDDNQTQCSQFSIEPRWRRYDEIVDATEISVKPDLLLNKVTDPEVQFQLFLFSAEGKLSRKLRAKAAGLDRDIQRAEPVITATEEMATEGLALVGSVGDIVADISDGTNKAEDAFKQFGTILKFFEPFPYVGTVIKGTKLPTICSQVAKRLNDGTKALDKTDTAVTKVIRPIEEFTTVVRRISASLTSSMAFLQGFVEFVTRTSFCAYKKGFHDYFERVQTWISALMQNVGKALAFISELKGHLSVLNKFQDLMKSDIFNAFTSFRSIIKDIVSFIDVLCEKVSNFVYSLNAFDRSSSEITIRRHTAFLDDLNDFDLCVGVPSFELIVEEPFIKLYWNDKKCTDLEGIGAFMRKIEDVIKDIPIVKGLWRDFEDLVNGILEALFKFVGSFLPSFDIDTSFLDDITQKMTISMDDMYDGIDLFGGLIDIDGLTDWYDDAIEDVKAMIPDELLNMDLECTDVDCIISQLSNFGIDIPDIDADFPSLKISGVDFSLPDQSIDIVDKVLGEFDGAPAIDGFQKDLQELFEKGVECRQYTTVRVDLMAYLRAGFGLAEGDIAGVPDCPFNFRICTDAHFPGLDDFNTNMNDRIDALGLKESFSRRRLANTCKNGCTSRGVALPLELSGVSDSGRALEREIMTQLFKFDGFEKDWQEALLSSGLSFGHFFVSNRGRALLKAFCDKYKKICFPYSTGVGDDDEALFASLLDFSIKLVIGETPEEFPENSGQIEQRFQTKIKIGGFFNVGFNFPLPPTGRTTKAPWVGISQQAKKAVEDKYIGGPARSKDWREFDEQATFVHTFSQINCLLDYMDATREFLRADKAGVGGIAVWESFLDNERHRQIEETMKEEYKLLDTRRNNGGRTKEWFNALLTDARKEYESETKYLEKLLDDLEKKHDYDTRTRSEITLEIQRSPSSGKQDYLEDYVNLWGSEDRLGYEAKPECVATNSKRSLLASLENFLKTRPRGSGAVAREALHFFYGFDVWKKISDIEFHNEAYGNLFGAGMDVSIVRQSLLGNLDVDTTEFKTSLVGPFWVSGGNWTPPGAGAWADLAPWSAFEFITKWAAEGIPTAETGVVPSGSNLLDALQKAPQEADYLSYADRFKFKVEWSFLEFSLNIAGNETVGSPYDGTWCPSEKFCIGLGFDPANFNPTKETCKNKHTLVEFQDIGFCDGGSVNCIDVTYQDCLKINDDQCPKKVLANCAAWCGLLKGSILNDTDWPGCEYKPRCNDTTEMLAFKTDVNRHSYSDQVMVCSDLTIENCTQRAKTLSNAQRKKGKWRPAQELCKNACGNLGEGPDCDKDDVCECTVVPLILPSASPSESSAPSESPTVSLEPTSEPSEEPSSAPSSAPSSLPSSAPSADPSFKPSISLSPSSTPSGQPSQSFNPTGCTPPGNMGCSNSKKPCCSGPERCCGSGTNAVCCNDDSVCCGNGKHEVCCAAGEQCVSDVCTALME